MAHSATHYELVSFTFVPHHISSHNINTFYYEQESPAGSSKFPNGHQGELGA
jgi:peptide methionine sulfoxide reductase MsrA